MAQGTDGNEPPLTLASLGFEFIPEEEEDPLVELVRARLLELQAGTPPTFDEEEDKERARLLAGNCKPTMRMAVLARVNRNQGVVPTTSLASYFAILLIIRKLGMGEELLLTWLAEQCNPKNSCILPFWVMLSFVYANPNVEITDEFEDRFYERFNYFCLTAHISYKDSREVFESKWNPFFRPEFFEAFARQFLRYYRIPFANVADLNAHRENFIKALMFLAKLRRRLGFGESNFHHILPFAQTM